jgi:hypothetical protein
MAYMKFVRPSFLAWLWMALVYVTHRKAVKGERAWCTHGCHARASWG